MTDEQPKLSHVGKALCFFCREPMTIMLDPGLKQSLPDEAVYNLDPCEKCKKAMETGYILMGWNDQQKLPANPQPMDFERTGEWLVMTEEGLQELLKNNPRTLEGVKKLRYMFIPGKLARAMIQASEKVAVNPLVTTSVVTQ